MYWQGGGWCREQGYLQRRDGEHLRSVLFFCLMAAWLNEVVVRAVALLSALTKEFDAYYSVVKWQLYKPAMNTEYDQQSPRECRYLYWRVQ